MAAVVDLSVLREFNACAEQTELFQRLFPHGAEITEEFLERAAIGGLDLEFMFDDKALIKRLGFRKVYVRQGFVTLRRGLLHSYDNYPALVVPDQYEYGLVQVSWFSKGERSLRLSFDADNNVFTYKRDATKKQLRRGALIAMRLGDLLNYE